MKYINEAINENLKIERRRKRNCIILLSFEVFMNWVKKYLNKKNLLKNLHVKNKARLFLYKYFYF
jgi:hypothetical protein